jgi:hypothetical protein
LKKSPEKETAPGRWRTADEKLGRLLMAESGHGTEGLTEEELAAVGARRFERADPETREAIVRLALRLRSPLTAKELVAKAGPQLPLDTLATLAALLPLAGGQPAWLEGAPALRDAIEASGGGPALDPEREADRLADLPPELRAPALRALARKAGEAAVPIAAALARRAPELRLEIAEWLTAVPAQATADLLIRFLSETTDKSDVKALRRLLQRLRQAGVAFELPKEGEPIFRPAERARPEAHVSGIDAHGARLVFLVQPRMPTGLHLFEALLSDERGLLEFRAYETQRRGVDKFLEALRERPALLLTEVDPRHARALLAEAMEGNVRSGTRLPPGASELRPIWDAGDGSAEAESPASPQPPSTSAGPGRGTPGGSAAGDEASRSALASSARLLEHEAFKGWYADPDLVKPTIDRIHDAASSKIVLSPLQKQERLASMVREATEEIFAAGRPQDHRGRYARRLAEMAMLLSLRGETEPALEARAASEHLADPGSKASLNPFAYALVEKTLVILTRDEEERERKSKEEEPPSLIVKP